ncbi:hypothetical protein Taro_038828, partial [Colocasia esculenta]|nr:hypothetical protein [Colocasia esculenta]
LRLEELGEELERSFLSTKSPPLGLSSWSRNLLARARTGHEGLREVNDPFSLVASTDSHQARASFSSWNVASISLSPIAHCMTRKILSVSWSQCSASSGSMDPLNLGRLHHDCRLLEWLAQ